MNRWQAVRLSFLLGLNSGEIRLTVHLISTARVLNNVPFNFKEDNTFQPEGSDTGPTITPSSIYAADLRTEGVGAIRRTKYNNVLDRLSHFSRIH